jgi:ubiquinone/menaquinone biosynthesis C-methylase UbiE
MDITREAEFFDRFEVEHGDYDVFGERAYRRILSEFAALVQPREGESCVDLGCGTGAFTRRLEGFGLRLIGMDISPRSIASAARQMPGHEYVVGDIRKTGFDDARFDVVVYSGVLHHCHTRATRVEILREGFRITKPGGRLFTFDPNMQSPSMWLYRDPRSPLSSRKGKTENEVLIHRRELREDLEEAGFREVTIQGVAGICFRYLEDRVARALLPLYNVYEEILRRSPFEDRLGTFLIGFATKRS